MIKTPKTISAATALSRLESLCSRSEQCTSEARKKLANWHISASDAESIISSLVNRRFIDDARFCRAFVRDKLMFAHWGRRKITLSLIQKRLDRDKIKSALDEINEEDYLAILKKIVSAKAKTISDADTYDGRTRLFRFAVSRGFEPALVSQVIREMTAGQSISIESP